MKTVKRKAKAGEKIRTVNGSVGKVMNVWDDHIDASDINDGIEFRVFHANYEVIIEDEPKDFEEQFKKISAVTEHSSKRIAEASKRMAEKLTAECIPPHSSHYHQNGLDPLEVMRRTFPPEQYEGFLRGNALKYIMRYPLKGTPVEDLEKAEEYIQMLLEYQRNPEGRTKVTLRNAQGDIIEETYEEDAE